ncbi:hypothetical protein P5G51_018490 [Virgibacillus sp. 179-BFC.A HS]|uniref:Uncharacterized protein n=1 Tax=Tigheibacillus jepli TaxID=3035914 RepID=A0ABU5CL31_9BACI|nr:hypothetical protein [Virgibacillus sp. 179-BFC.A HS]MDY0407058.1 hypothetical protein [Virgibacillus sp. 179-BFC.A HS]
MLFFSKELLLSFAPVMIAIMAAIVTGTVIFQVSANLSRRKR